MDEPKFIVRTETIDGKRHYRSFENEDEATDFADAVSWKPDVVSAAIYYLTTL